MIKFKHLVALSMTAAVAVNASADEVTAHVMPASPSTIELTGKILAPTCTVAVESEKSALPDITTSKLKGKYTTSDEHSFTLSLTDSVASGPCPTISYATNSTGQTVPSIYIGGLTQNVTTEGYLINTAEDGPETASVGVQLLNGDKVLNLKEVKKILSKDAQVELKARYIALADQVHAQLVKVSFNVGVDYK